MAKLLLFATIHEAQATLTKTDAKPIDHCSYEYDEGLIVISGLGSYASQMAVAKYHHTVSEIINLGFAASLKSFTIGDVFTCGTVGKYVPLPIALDPISSEFMDKAIPKQQISHQGMRLISSDFPVHAKSLRDNLSDWDLLDMEGYGVAFAASYFQKKCTLIKAVSDFAKENGRDYIEAHKQKLSHLLSQHVSNNLSFEFK